METISNIYKTDKRIGHNNSDLFGVRGFQQNGVLESSRAGTANRSSEKKKPPTMQRMLNMSFSSRKKGQCHVDMLTETKDNNVKGSGIKVFAHPQRYDSQ